MRFTTSTVIALAIATALPALAAPTEGYEELVARARKGGSRKGGSSKRPSRNGGSRFNTGKALEHANNAVGIASGVAGLMGRDFIDLEERDFIDFEARDFTELEVRAPMKPPKKPSTMKPSTKSSSRKNGSGGGRKPKIGKALGHANNAVASGVAGMFGRDFIDLEAREPKKGAKKGGSKKPAKKSSSRKPRSRGGRKFHIGNALEHANNAVGIASGIAGMVQGRDFVDVESRDYDELFERSTLEDLVEREYFEDLYSRDFEDLEARDDFIWWT